jgi:hypothetical protein
LINCRTSLRRTLTDPLKREKMTFTKLTATEFIAFGFYIVPFFYAVVNYQMSNGLGLIRVPEHCDFAGVWTIILWTVLLTNAAHFHLANWDVDEDEEFQKFKKDGIDTVPPPERSWVAVEWTLRISCLVCIYLMPFTLFGDGRGRGYEVLLLVLYASIWLWDIAVAAKLGMQFVPSLRLSYAIYPNPEDRLANFKRKVNIWCAVESVGLLLSYLYIVISLKVTSPPAFTLLLGGIVLIYLLLVLVESTVVDAKTYWLRAVASAAFGGGLIFLITKLMSLRMS